MADFRYVIKAGDTLPVLADALLDADGVAVDATGATVEFRAQSAADPSIRFSGAGSLGASPAAGDVTYAWASADTENPGEYNCEWELTVGGATRTIPEQGYYRLKISEKVPT